jgi:hypothetical protein
MAFRPGSALLIALAAACDAPEPPTAARPAVADMVLAGALIGDWQWTVTIDEPGLRRVEREHWRIAPSPAPDGALPGAYLREVEVTATDGVPFVCNQRTRYTQRARFDLRATALDGNVVIEETGFRAEPSPCDHGFRRLGHYFARVGPRRLDLRWEIGDDAPATTADAPRTGTQTLTRVPRPPTRTATADALEASWPGDVATWNGPWRWQIRTVDDARRVRDEREEWELTVGGSGAAATYRRTVTVHAATGAPLPCAGAASYTYVDHYVLEGALSPDRDGILELREVAVDPGQHPCLDASPRALDSVTAELDGEYVELTWRGKRRQVLHRP